MHRGQLQMLLLAAVRDRIGPHAVRTGTPLLDLTQDEDRVRVRVPDGEIVADALVGADGLHSVVRERLHPGQGPMRWSGVRMWRGVTELPPFLSGRSMVIALGPGNVELITYPIGRSTVNWVVMVPVAEPGPLPDEANWNQPGRPDDVLAHLRDWALGWLDVAGLIGNSALVLEYPMVDRDPLPWWGRGRVTLLGDAAHPMYPVGANGASQAIVDARVLAEELARDFATGLTGYERIRRPATAAVVAANREMHRASDARTPGELARITETYRRATGADTHQLRSA